MKRFETGKYLFKFAKLDKYTLYNLLNRELHFSNPDVLNDPVDSKPILNITNLKELKPKDVKPMISRNPDYSVYSHSIQMQISKMMLNKPYDIVNFVNRAKNKNSNPKVRLCSFSIDLKDDQQVCKEQLMWSHYGDSSKGICLVFDKETLEEKLKVNTNVFYDNDTLSHIYGDNVNYAPQNTSFSITIRNGEIEFNKKIYLHKSSNWEYESEYRLIQYAESLPKIDKPLDYWNIKFGDALMFVILGEKTTYKDFISLEQINKIYENGNVAPFKFLHCNRNIMDNNLIHTPDYVPK